jgi:hypothetical protein
VEASFPVRCLKLKLSFDRRSVGQCVLVSGSRLELRTRFFFSVWQLCVSWCLASSLTNGWVCNLLVQLLLALARAITLGFKSHRTRCHISLSHLRLSLPGGPDPRIYVPQEQDGPIISPGPGLPLRCLLRLAGIYFNPPPHGNIRCLSYQRKLCWSVRVIFM